MSRRQIVERERRWAPWVAAASVLPFLGYVAALIVESGTLTSSDLLTEELRSIDANSGSLLLATIFRVVAFLAMAVPLVYLFRAAQARSDRVQGGLIGFAVLGPVLLAIQGIVAYVAQTDVASQFVSQEAGVGDIYSLAENLLEESSARQAASGMLLAGVLALIFAMVYTPLWAVRTGLLTRFFGTFGMALGASLLFILQVSLLVILCWFAYFGLVVIGRSARGRPPAWDAGEAIPWPRPGEEPALAPEPDAIDRDASQIPGLEEGGDAPQPGSSRPQKRKRRGP